jgi:hypothetical protein
MSGVNFAVIGRVYICDPQHDKREVDPMIEIELRQEILNTVLHHRNTCNSKHFRFIY